MARATRVYCSGSDKEESHPEPSASLERRGSDWGCMLDKTQEFFKTCDLEGKGFITRTDMRRLHRELSLNAEELENVFDSLDSNKDGYLTLGEFTSGVSEFLHGRGISTSEVQVSVVTRKAPEALYQSQWDERLTGSEDDEERHFCMLLESLGASNVFEDPGEVRSLWAQLRRDEPHLLSNFEEFLARVTDQIKEAQQERREMESALKRKEATHDSEIRRLYEEMELQIKNEKDRLLLKDSERLQLRSQDLQDQLSSKEQDLEQLFQKQRRLESQCRELHSEHQETRVENVKLKLTNEELSSELEHTCQELALAQEQLAILQEQASRLQQEREMEMYRVTESLQREKHSLMKQLDLLREMNRHLRDEKDISSLKSNIPVKMSSHKQRLGSASLKRSEEAAEEADQQSNRESSAVVNGHAPVTDGKEEAEVGVVGWPRQRVISIEEDHLPDLLLGEPRGEEEEDEDQIELQMSSIYPADPPATPQPSAGSPPPSGRRTPRPRAGNAPTAARGQPVGKETLQHGPVEGAVAAPDRLFKIILVGNSSVGKTALLRRFCDGRFHPATLATVGIDYSVRTLSVGDSQVALQMWDTAGQERYRSITKQFFRRADGVVIIYDVTVEETFRAVWPWLANVQEAAGDAIPIMLLGNKSDKETEREVQPREGERLAEDIELIFYECSAFTGHNVMEAMVHLARVLKDQEDREKEKTVRLGDQPLKKKSCC